MANLQLLKKRLKSINATGNLASAMKTVASVKHTQIGKLVSSFNEYYEALDAELDLISKSAFSRIGVEVKNRNCVVVLSSNRGFCGGFNHEIFRFIEKEEISKQIKAEPLIVACGKKAERYFADKGVEAINFAVSDVPEFAQARELTDFLLDTYLTGEADKVFMVYQKYTNMMSQTPEIFKILPYEHDAKEDKEIKDVLYLPDKESFSKNLALDALTSIVYNIMLLHAYGAQGSTVIAMKNAYDNALESSRKLDIQINRIRQANVTNSVIETSSGMAMKYEV